MIFPSELLAQVIKARAMGQYPAPPNGFPEVFDLDAASVREWPSLRELARRALAEPGELTPAEVQQLGFAFIVATGLSKVTITERIR